MNTIILTKRPRINRIYSSSWVDENKVTQSFKKEKIKQTLNRMFIGIEKKDKLLFTYSCYELMSL